MTQMRFTEEDFNTFTIEGLDARMEVLKDTYFITVHTSFKKIECV